MLRNFYAAYFILNFVILAHGEGVYTVIAPGTLRPYFKYNVAVTVHEAGEPCEVEVSITGSTYNISKTIEMPPMSTKTVEFEMPKLKNDYYRLSVKGVSGIIFENSTSLNFVNYDPLVYIQIDKPIYKPGDLVQFRVLFLNQNTYPEHLKKPVRIVIKDGNSNTIQQWKNINLTHGVYTGNFQLSEHAMQDWWNIAVYYGKNQIQGKSIGVIKYNSPNFEVFVDAPENVAVTDEFMTVTVRAKYTFGKPVKGKATISIVHYAGENFSINKTFPVDGKGHVELNVWKDLPKSELIIDGKIRNYRIDASVEEELTGKIQNAPTSYFNLHKNDIIMTTLKRFSIYQPGQRTTYTVVGKKFDGSPVEDNMNTVKLIIDDDFEFYSMFNKSGIATFKFVLPDFVYNKPVSSSYLGTLTNLGYVSPEVESEVRNLGPERFQLNLLTQKPQLKKDLLIEAKWNEPITYFVYIVVARGNIVKVERVEVPNNSQSYIIKIIPTLDMIPTASIFVQYIFENNLRFEEQTIVFENDFENTLEISASAEASPGDEIEFQISTDPNSYVGLLGIDQSILLYGTDHDLDQNKIFKDLRGYRTYTPNIPGSGRYPGKISGLVSLTNAHFPWSYLSYSYGGAGGGDSGASVPRTRFPETWIFDNFNITNQTQLSFTKRIPDTITSWVITGFSMNSNTGLALTKNPTKIQVFKPFFITINLPYSVKQGEIIAIPVLVFNYMNKTADTEVTMDNSDSEFDFVEAINEINERSVDKAKEFKRVSVPSNSARSVSFMIKPKIVGTLTLKVTALTALAGDIVHKKLKVEPEGVTQYQNRAFFVNLNDKREQKETITVDIPANVVPYSEYVELSAIGDLVGLSFTHISDLIRLPIGYGEQNMINFVPSILILKYLKTIDHQMPNITKTAKKILRIGFQRELSFRHNDGSYSAYGKSDTSGIIHGSTWLTAYVARSFQQASEFIDIDQETIMKSFEFLATKQTTNGNFAEFGHLLEYPHLNDISLSAFVLLAFLENMENYSKYETHIKKGIEFIIKSSDETEDIYSLSITALVLQKVNHPLADEYLTKLKSSAKNENGLTWWSADIQRQKRQKYVYKSSDIEITSYILLAMLEKEPTENVLPIVKWLTMQRNSNGGFTSTQDTVVGLQALIKFVEKTGLSRTGSMDIEYISEGNGVENKGTIRIFPRNLMMLNTHELPKNTRKVAITAKGNASSLVQLSYKYNTIDKEPEQSFRLNIIVRENTPPKLLIIDICAEFVPTDADNEEKKTNMIVIEVDLPSGYTTGSEDLQKIRDFKTILFTETKKSDTVAIIYLQSLEAADQKCISVTATKLHDVAKQKPVPVVIYDCYDKERRATEYYEVKSSLCEICDGYDCAIGCKRSKGILSNRTTFDL